MRVSSLPREARPAAIRFPLREGPHLTLEPTRRCNLACRLCYTRDKGHVKSLAAVRQELDFACRRRRLHAVTLVGGEPTLHDGIVELVAEVKRRGLVCQVLTNGLTLQSEGGDLLLQNLIGAGLDKIALHVDGGQGHPDVEAVRERLFDRCEAARLLFSLSLTVYPEAEGEIPALVRRYARYRYFDGILAVLGRDPGRLEPHGPMLEAQHRALASRLGLAPSGYVPSSAGDDEAFWLVYLYFVRADTGRTFGLSPRLQRAGRAVGRALTGRHWLVPTFDPRRAPGRFLLLGALDVLLDPRRVGSFLGMLHGRGALASLRSHYIAIQRPPEIDPGSGELVLCYHCPDATVRNGRLTPVCLADFVSPFTGAPVEELHARWRRAVDTHLGEA
ncbi:MAG: radical SAM protein [Betaproteobacteria bacterium]